MLPADAEKLDRIVRQFAASSESRSLADLMGACQRPCGVELSFRIRPGQIDVGRFLLSQAREAFAGREEEFWSALAGLGLDTSAVRREVPHAEFLHLGYEHGGEPVCKFYAEFPADDSQASQLVHLAWKWRPSRPGDAALDEYRRIGAEPLRGVLRAAQGGACSVVAAPLVAWLEERAVDLGALFALLVRGTGSQRTSIDLRLYDLGLRIRDLEPALRAIADSMMLPPAALDSILIERGSDRLGHVAFGVSGGGEPFATVYGGMAVIQPIAHP